MCPDEPVRVSQDPRSAAPGTENELELRLVNYLISCLERRLGDRGGKRHEPGWEPRQNVVLGVLGSVIVQSDVLSQAGSETHGETSANEQDVAVPDDADLPS